MIFHFIFSHIVRPRSFSTLEGPTVWPYAKGLEEKLKNKSSHLKGEYWSNEDDGVREVQLVCPHVSPEIWTHSSNWLTSYLNRRRLAQLLFCSHYNWTENDFLATLYWIRDILYPWTQDGRMLPILRYLFRWQGLFKTNGKNKPW